MFLLILSSEKKSLLHFHSEIEAILITAKMLSQIRERKVDQLISINLELVYHDYWHSRDPLGESFTHLSSLHNSLWSKLHLHERFLLRFYTNWMRFLLGQIQS